MRRGGPCRSESNWRPLRFYQPDDADQYPKAEFFIQFQAYLKSLAHEAGCKGAAGGFTWLARVEDLLESGEARCCGDNSDGALGDGLTEHYDCGGYDCGPVPVTVAGLDTITQVEVVEAFPRLRMDLDAVTAAHIRRVLGMTGGKIHGPGGAGDVEVAPEVVEAPDAAERVAQDQDRPAVAEDVEAPNADMVSGMLTAIQDFVRDSFTVDGQDSLDDMSTLAHEYGHAIHSALAMEHQPYHNYRYVPFLAEVASTCNEVILSDHLVDRAADKAQKIALLTERAENIRTTIQP